MMIRHAITLLALSVAHTHTAQRTAPGLVSSATAHSGEGTSVRCKHAHTVTDNVLCVLRVRAYENGQAFVYPTASDCTEDAQGPFQDVNDHGGCEQVTVGWVKLVCTDVQTNAGMLQFFANEGCNDEDLQGTAEFFGHGCAPFNGKMAGWEARARCGYEVPYVETNSSSSSSSTAEDVFSSSSSSSADGENGASALAASASSSLLVVALTAALILAASS